MLNELSPWHLIIILLLFALLFGAKRLPEAARGLGRSMRIFRAEMQSARDESPDAATAWQPGVAPTQQTMQQQTTAQQTTPVQDAVPQQAAPVQPVVPPAVTTPVPAASVAEPARPTVN